MVALAGGAVTEAHEVRWPDGAAIPCPLCGTTLVDEAGTLVFCPHLLAVASDGDGPCARREDGSAAELAESVARTVRRPWTEVRVRVEGNPHNWTWTVDLAWSSSVPVGDRLAAWEHASLAVY